MSSAGQQLVAGRIPGERIATTEEVADSSNFTTTETVIMTVTAPLISGRTYRITASTGLATSSAGDIVETVLREDSLIGTAIDATRLEISSVSTGSPYRGLLASDFTAVSTSNKTFVVTAVRIAGTGNIRMEAATSRKSFIQVTYESG